jgi:5,10-methylenetetrahydromethanopterin reductase
MSEAKDMTFWTLLNGFPGNSARNAAAAEQHGWDGMWAPDSQNLTGDPYVALTVAGHATTTLQVKTGVTNPLTRHPAVTASSIATVQQETGGRATLGIGRGDSALAYIGLAPVPVPFFVDYVGKVQAYLRGEKVPFELESHAAKGVRSAESLQLGGRPTESQLRWWRHATVEKPKVEIAASGPRVIKAAALIADKLNFAVGSDPERVKWAIDLALESRAESGLDLPPIEFSILVGVAVDEDTATAHQLVSESMLAGLTRFSVMHGTATGPVSEKVADSLAKVHDGYDMNKHGRPGRQADEVDEDLINTFAIAGTPEYCISRMTELAALGVTHMDLVSGWGVDHETGVVSQPLLTERVLPGVREALAATRSAAPAGAR